MADTVAPGSLMVLLRPSVCNPLYALDFCSAAACLDPVAIVRVHARYFVHISRAVSPPLSR